MSQKLSGKTSASAIPSRTGMREEFEKLIQKERLKDAVKQAKLLFKDESTPENHRLLENAYFSGRASFSSSRMPESAIEVAQHLLEFGLTSTEWADEFVRLLIKLGLADEAFEIQARSGSPELKDQLVALAADQAVIHPERMQDVSAEMAREASLIRESLEKLTAGDMENGLAMLRDLPRSSPLSDWKFFVRGLAAYYQGNSEEARRTGAGWTPIAKPLLSRRGWSRSRPAARRMLAVPSLAALEKVAFGEPVLERLANLRRLAGRAGLGQGKPLAGFAALSPAPHRSEARRIG